MKNNILDIDKEKVAQRLYQQILKIIKNQMFFSVWLSYDLGLDENAEKVTKKEYDKLYNKRYAPFMEWLKKHSAQECGKSVATFIAMSRDVQSLKNEFKNELKAVGIEGEGIRIYAIISDLADFNSKQSDFEQNKIRYAGFIIGQREAAVWEENKKPSYKNVDI